MNSNSQKDVQEPSEIEVWKLMMDSMIKFTSAATKLMNTITARVETTAPPIPSVNGEKCEEECFVCPTRSPNECKKCAAALLSETEKLKTPSDKATASTAPTATASTAPTATASTAPTATASTAPTATASTAPTATATDPVSTATDSTATDFIAPASTAPASTATDPTATGSTATAPADPEVPPDKPEKPEKDCICTEIIKLKKFVKTDEKDNEKPCTCCKGRRGGEQSKQEKETTLCACDISPAQMEQMKSDLTSKLNKAEENLAVLQKEMVKFQSYESGKKNQSAALYKEIMKDNTLDRKSLSKTRAVGSNPAIWQPQNRSRVRIVCIANASAQNIQSDQVEQEEPCILNSCIRKQSIQDIYNIQSDVGGDPSDGGKNSAPYMYSEPTENIVAPSVGHGEYISYCEYSEQGEFIPQEFSTPYYTEVTEKSAMSLQIEKLHSYNVPSELNQTFVRSPHDFYISCPNYNHCKTFPTKQRMQTSSGQKLSRFQYPETNAEYNQSSVRTSSGHRSLGVRLRFRSKPPADPSFVTQKRHIPPVQPLVARAQKGWRPLPQSSLQRPRTATKHPGVDNVCPGVCYNPPSQTDYMNPAFVTDSQEYIGIHS